VKYLKILFLLLGLSLLGVVLYQTDLVELWRRVVELGWLGMGAVLGLFFVSFAVDVVAWALAFDSIPMSARWLSRLYLVRMVGEAFNNVTPTASMGGEPIKAMLLKTHYDVGYRESMATVVIAKTTILIGLLFFLIVGFALLLNSDKVPEAYKSVAGVGLIGLSVIIVNFFLWQRLRLTSRAGAWLSASRFGGRLKHWLEVIADIDDQFVGFYKHKRARFGGALVLVIFNWVLGVAEVYLVMHLLGYPVSMTDAWIIESMAQLVRAGAFFIPAAIGAQEGTFMLLCGAITGNPTLGIAVALVRRAREVIWIAAGLGLWWRYSLKNQDTASANASSTDR
jgi:uncharacterized protein (TIRG00374 family)